MAKARGAFRRIWTAAAISHAGNGVTRAALPLLAASVTRSPTAVAAVTFAETLPWLCFALPGGALADRIDRRLAMVRTDLFRMVVIGALGVATLVDRASIPLICVVAFLLGSAATIFDNAAQSILPSVVERAELERANSRLYAAEIVADSFVGLPLGSLLFAVAAALPFLLDAGSFGAAALLLVGMTGSFRAERPDTPPTLRRDIAEGLRWLWHHRLLRTLAIALGLINLVEAASTSVFVLFALEVLGISRAGFGFVLMSGAIGALAGTAFAPRLSRRIGAGALLVGTVVVMGLAALAPGIWPRLGVTVAAFIATAAAGVAWNVVTVSLRQAIVPDHLLGRVNSAYRLLAWGSMPIGAALGGVVAAHFGLRAPFIVAGTSTLVLAAVIAPQVRTRAIDAARAAAERA